MARLSLRRSARSPFEGRGPYPLIVHCSYHKTGTGWFRKILQRVAQKYGLKLQIRRSDQPLEPGVAILLNQGSRVPVEGVPYVRGSHIVRDPRDVAVSAYHYHLWTNEKWVHVPDDAYGGKTYQEFLRSLDQNEGLSAEIQRLATTVFRRMARWDYAQPDYLELRYEDVILDERAWFDRLFRHYTFHESAITDALAIAEEMSFRSSGRAVGEVREGQKMRSGRPGQWREEFTEQHVELFRNLTGDLVVRLGYEKDDRW